jgi:hypothetical protein
MAAGFGGTLRYAHCSMGEAAVTSSGLRSVALDRWKLAFALTAVAGIVLRVWIYRSALGIPNSDEAVLGLMAIGAEHGHLTAFFWGQSYGGSQEALLTVPLFWVFGPSWLALRVVPIALHAVAALLVWRVGLRTVSRTAAGAAGALYWIWPPFLVFQLSRQQACYYASGVTYAALLLLLGLRVVERPDAKRVGLFGLVFGLGFWQTTQVIPAAAGVILWTVWKAPACLRKLWAAIPLAVVGALPWLLFNLHHNWASLTLPSGDSTYVHRFRIFFSPLLPMLLGLRRPFTQALLLPHLLTYLILLLLAVVFVAGLLRSRGRPVFVLYVTAIAYPFLSAFNPLAGQSSDPRYLLLLTPAIVLMLAQLMRSYPVAVLALAIGFAATLVTLHRMNAEAQSALATQPVPPRNISPLLSTLDRLHLRDVYGDYWIAYLIDFDSHGRILAVHNKLYPGTFRDGQVTPAPDPFPRRRDWEREIAAARHGFVIYREQMHTYRIVAQLERHHYRIVRVQNFVVFAPPAA